MKNNPKTKMQKALSLFLTLLMVLGTLSIIGPISVAAATSDWTQYVTSAASVQYFHVDGQDYIVKPGETTPYEIWINGPDAGNITFAKNYNTTQTPLEVNDTDGDWLRWDINNNKNTSFITVPFDAVPTNKAVELATRGRFTYSELATASKPRRVFYLRGAASETLNLGQKYQTDQTTLTLPTGTHIYTDAIALDGSTIATTISGTAINEVAYQTHSSKFSGTSAYVDFGWMGIFSVAGLNDSTLAADKRFDYATYANNATVVVKDGEGNILGVKSGAKTSTTIDLTEYENGFDSSFEGWTINGTDVVSTKGTGTSYAVTENVTLVPKFSSLSITYNGGSSESTECATLGELLENKDFDFQKMVGEDYQIYTGGITVNGNAESFDYILKSGDAIVTTGAAYENVYVYLPEQLYAITSHDTGDDTPVNVELSEGYLRVTPDSSTYSTSAVEKSSYRVTFDINGKADKAAKKLFTSYRNTDIDLTATPYYTIAYKTNITNIQSEQLSTNMQLWTGSKYEWKFPRYDSEDKPADGTDQEWTFNLTEDSRTKDFLTNGIAAVRIPIYSGKAYNITAQDYFDIKYMGFFPSAEAKELFDFDEYRDEYVYNGITVSATPGGTITTDNGAVETYNPSVLVGSAFDVTAAADSDDYVLRNWYDITNGNNVPVNAVADGEAVLATTLVAKSNDMWVVANFDSATAEFPIPLIAFLDSASATLGKIKLENDDPTTYIYAEEVYPSETKTLTAVPTESNVFLYWKRYTQAGEAEVFLSSATSYDAHPLGGDVYYTPVFATSTGNLYIDKYTYEILKDYTPTGTEVANELLSTDALNVYLIDPTLDTTEKASVTVVGLGNAWTATPAEDFKFGNGFTVSPTTGRTGDPVWSIKVGEGVDVVVSYANQFKFNYMFAPNTAITITEGTLSGNKQNVIANLASWQETGYANFTAAFELNVAGAADVEHGVLMSKTESDLTNLEGGTTFKVPNGVIVGRVTATGADQTTIYTISKKLDGTETWYGRAYCTYTVGGATYVIYADDVLTASK